MTRHAWTFTDHPRSGIGQVCPDCQSIHCPTDVVAVGRFNSDGPIGYRPRGGGDLRATRAEAMSDVCITRRATS